MAMEGFIKSAAVEYAKKSVRINMVSPGFIKTSYMTISQNQKKPTNGY